MARLIDTLNNNKEYLLPERGPFTIGRYDTNDFIPNLDNGIAWTVSRAHGGIMTTLLADGNRTTIVSDNGTKYGTRIIRGKKTIEIRPRRDEEYPEGRTARTEKTWGQALEDGDNVFFGEYGPVIYSEY